ncbi:hypothetical protein [Novosphingobium sp. Leaf2]|uniref:hypothetical protein n=1 Tax=Novosphingobium sp. Leaf2 TaxID=1735670 RepID=UPI0006FF41D6|nr:hypothetical protein [Novosphingobium sp. Leaf2]KQM21360.1 hypothetical protein ASE49_14865 [Novosphingobium sp. Leaf2]
MAVPGHRYLTTSALAGASALVLALGVAGCNKSADGAANGTVSALPALPATLPMTTAAAQQCALAPPAAAIPASQPIRTVRVPERRAAYAYADQASYFSQSLGDAPPDYGFDYDGVEPWAWQAYDGSRVFMEPVSDGYRYYYYRTGADRPYFIRDPQYGYGYDGDQLAVIYGPDGGIIPYDDYGPRLNYASAYLWRAQRLYDASRERQAIAAADWAARENAIVEGRERWMENRDRQADWAAYHAQEDAQQSRYWAQEAARRDADQQRFAQWRDQDFRTPPPPRAIPASWQQASWAHDNAHYAPIAAAAVGGAALAALAVHHHQAMAMEREAARRQTFAAPQPLVAQRFAGPAGGPAGPGRGFDPAGRGPMAGPRGERFGSPVGATPAGPARFGGYHGAPAAALMAQRQHPGRPGGAPVGPAANRHQANFARSDRIAAQEARAVRVHEGNRPAFRGEPNAARYGAPHNRPAVHVTAGYAAPRGHGQEAFRGPVEAPRMAPAAARHGSERPSGGYPGGGRPQGHPGGGRPPAARPVEGHPGGGHSGGGRPGEHHH